jgi:endo-1,4-beta-xylanase
MKLLTAVFTAFAVLVLSVPAQAAKDRTGPTITIKSPTATTYAKGSSVKANYTCSDPSGVSTCKGPVANGASVNTNTAGKFTFTVTAKDKLGNSSSKSVSYTVSTSGWTGSCANGYVALSYDDGPTTLTRQYVDTLVANGAQATFFDIGDNINARPSDVQYAVDHGMDIGDHTMTHPHLPDIPDDQWQAEIRDQQTLVRSLTGFGEWLFRPPYGESSGPIWDYSESLGMRETKWSLDTNDWQGLSTASIVSTASQMQNQSIILMHDGYPNTLNAMTQIFSVMKSKSLCPGKIVPSWDNPIYTSWGEAMFLNVVHF